MTHRQIQTLRFISEWIREHGFSPSLQEIAEGLGGKSVSTVDGLVEALQNRDLRAARDKLDEIRASLK